VEKCRSDECAELFGARSGPVALVELDFYAEIAPARELSAELGHEAVRAAAVGVVASHAKPWLLLGEITLHREAEPAFTWMGGIIEQADIGAPPHAGKDGRERMGAQVHDAHGLFERGEHDAADARSVRRIKLLENALSFGDR
jgi:hypothetical protein